jgi:periplasmic divalent cation tolerance protein
VAGHIIALTTVGSQDDALRIARELVERRLAACINIVGPVHSVYRWKGTIHDATERVLLIKTVSEDFPRLRDAIVKLHSYELPEVVALAVVDGLETYLNWITAGSSEVPVKLP